MDDKSGSEGSDSDASTSASDEEEEAGKDGNTAPARKRAASNKARAAALDILQGQSGPLNLLDFFFSNSFLFCLVFDHCFGHTAKSVWLHEPVQVPISYFGLSKHPCWIVYGQMCQYRCACFTYITLLLWKCHFSEMKLHGCRWSGFFCFITN